MHSSRAFSELLETLDFGRLPPVCVTRPLWTWLGARWGCLAAQTCTVGQGCCVVERALRQGTHLTQCKGMIMEVWLSSHCLARARDAATSPLQRSMAAFCAEVLSSECTWHIRGFRVMLLQSCEETAFSCFMHQKYLNGFSHNCYLLEETRIRNDDP